MDASLFRARTRASSHSARAAFLHTHHTHTHAMDDPLSSSMSAAAADTVRKEARRGGRVLLSLSLAFLVLNALFSTPQAAAALSPSPTASPSGRDVAMYAPAEVSVGERRVVLPSVYFTLPILNAFLSLSTLSTQSPPSVARLPRPADGGLTAVASYGDLLGGGGGEDDEDGDDDPLSPHHHPPDRPGEAAGASPAPAPTPAAGGGRPADLPVAGSTTKTVAAAAPEHPGKEEEEDLDPLSAAAAADAGDDPLGASTAGGAPAASSSASLLLDRGALPPAPPGPATGPSVAAMPAGLGAAASPSRPGVAAQPPPASTAAPTGPLPPPAFPPCPYARIAVTDPVHRAEAGPIPGLNSGYWTFRVTSATKAPAELPASYPPAVPRPATTAAVRRRFRDFVDLADLLKISHRGWAIPPRPDKVAGLAGDALSLGGGSVGNGGGTAATTSTPTSPLAPSPPSTSSSPDWVEARRSALATYLARLAAHPAIGPSQQLAVFLTAEGPLGSAPAWTALLPLRASLFEGVARLPGQLMGTDVTLPSPSDVGRSAAASGDLYRRLKEMGVALRNELRDNAGVVGGGDGGPDVASPSSSTIPLPPGEADLRAVRSSMDALGEALATASRKAEAVVAAWEASGAALGDAGLALMKLAKGQDAAASSAGLYTPASAAAARVAADARRTGTTALRLSRLAKAATAEAAGALEPLHSALSMVPPAARALREREAAALTWQAVREELDAKKAVVEAARAAETGGGDPSAGRRASAAADAVAALTLAETAAAAEWRSVAGRNLADLARTAADRRVGLTQLVGALASVGAAYETRAAAVWKELADMGASAAAAFERGGDGPDG